MQHRIVQIVILSLFASLPAEANHGHHGDWARVVRSTPIYESRSVVTPHRECWSEDVIYERPAWTTYHRRYRHHRHRSPAPTLLGATIGGVIGHELGANRAGRRAGTVLGVVIGGSIGREIGRHHYRRLHRRHYRRHHDHRHHSVVETRRQRRCESREEVETERYVVGYDVEYRYRGRLYRARMDEEPGDRIRVALDVTPIEEVPD